MTMEDNGQAAMPSDDGADAALTPEDIAAFDEMDRMVDEHLRRARITGCHCNRKLAPPQHGSIWPTVIRREAQARRSEPTGEAAHRPRPLPRRRRGAPRRRPGAQAAPGSAAALAQAFAGGGGDPPAAAPAPLNPFVVRALAGRFAPAWCRVFFVVRDNPHIAP